MQQQSIRANLGPSHILKDLVSDLKCVENPDDLVIWAGSPLVFNSVFETERAAQVSIGLSGALAAEVFRRRTGTRQEVVVDTRHAAAEFRSERYLKVDGGPAPELWDPIAGLYRCKDGFVRVHTNFPHHRDGLLALVGAENNRESVQAKLMEWAAEPFETAMAERGLVATATRHFADWDALPAAKALVDQPVIKLTRIGDAPKRNFDPASRPLSGIRVLDLTRVIAGPVGGRTLAAHGADVLRITAAHLPFMAPLVIDAGRGKRSTQLDLRTEADRKALKALASEADVFVQGYRPGGLGDKGFAPKDLAEIRPGIVSASLSAYGPDGPWTGRRGFDSLVQNASGLNWAEADALGSDKPHPLPCQALDHASGYFLAAGIMAAMLRQMDEGGSWHVSVSLARTGLWVRSLGQRDLPGVPDQTPEDVSDLLYESDSDFGRLTAVTHAAKLSETPARWAQGSTKLDANEAVWLPR